MTYTSRNIPLIKPYISSAVKARVIEVLESGYLTEGAVTKELEQLVADYVNAKYAIAVTSCTTGLELALRALNIGAGDEVLVADYTYPATAAVVNIVGATPVLVDVNPYTMLMDRKSAETAINKNTKAIMPVSIFGNPLDYDWLMELKTTYKLSIVEDSACSLGASWKGKRTGSLADISVFSMHPRKFITTGEGGMVTTNDSKLAEWMASYKTFGIDAPKKERAEVCFSMTGTNYKLSNIQAAIGVEQMYVIDSLLKRRQELAKNYIKLLGTHSLIDLPLITENGEHSYQTFGVFINSRNEIMQALRQENIEVQIGTYSLHSQPGYAKCQHSSSMKGSQYAYENFLALPLYHELSSEDQYHVASRLIYYAEQFNR